ncbi:hypothetical protein KSP40_PGU011319 [Platanthera guangdongensis]|uniref:Uncharacterized protein n=1 Tax=Platanthera guangdongensis TaxID=2320717 RepID=A0ABR2M6M6_9ASPA
MLVRKFWKLLSDGKIPPRIPTFRFDLEEANGTAFGDSTPYAGRKPCPVRRSAFARVRPAAAGNHRLSPSYCSLLLFFYFFLQRMVLLSLRLDPPLLISS